MDKKIKEIFDSLGKTNNELIKEKRSICSMCFVISKAKEEGKFDIEGIPLEMSNYMKKVITRNLLKHYILMKEVVAYILIMDTWMSILSKEKGIERQEAIIRTIYTAQEKISVVVPYKDGIIGEIQELEGRSSSKDDWDLWGEGLNEEDIANAKKLGWKPQ